MSGDELSRAIKDWDDSIPILMVTGEGHAMNEAGEVPPGVDRVLGKPVHRSELLDAITKLLRMKPVR